MSEPYKMFKEKRRDDFSIAVSATYGPWNTTVSGLPSSKWLSWDASYSTPTHASPTLSLHDLSEKSSSVWMRYFDGSSSRIQRLVPTMSTSTATTNYAAMWKNFDLKWLDTCPYHRDQAISISKAKSEGLFNTDEAMSELRELREERQRCKECRV